MRRLLAFLGCSLIVTSVTLIAQSNSYYLPQVVDGAVKQGKLITTIVIANSGISTATLSLAFSKDDGTPLRISLVGLAESNEFSMSLNPGATRILKTSGTGNGVPGAAQITSNVAINVSAIVSAFNASGKLADAAGIGSSDSSTAYTVAVDTTGGLDTGIALYNPAAATAALTFKLFNVHGAQIGTVNENLTGGGHLSRFVAEGLFAGMGSFQGSMTVTSSIPVAGWILRQNSASPAYTLLKPSPTSSLRLKFYLPEVAEGEAGTTKTATTLQFVNLSANTATVKLSLSHNGGSPWQVTIAGEGTKAAFQFTLPPGGASFWHAMPPSSTTPYATGAALVTSDNPIALTAVATASDQHGNFIAETGLTEASPVTSFVIPFDLTNAASGAAFYNPEAQPATLAMTLLDENGNSLAKATASLASGGTLSAMMSTFFPHSKLTSGAVAISTGGPASAAISVAALQQLSSGVMLSSVPASPIGLTGTPVTITSTLDTQGQVTATIGGAGGTLNTTDAQGNQFTLTIPPNALLSPEAITMTPVTAISGFSLGKLSAGVQLGPDGTELYAPATLTITLAAPLSSPLPLGWHTNGPGIYLNLLQINKNTLTMQLMHFSGAGAVESGNVSAALVQIVNIWDLETSTIAYLLNVLREQQVAGCPPGNSECESVDANMVDDKIADLYADALIPLMQLALQTGDNDLLQCALAHTLQFQRQWLLVGEDNSGTSMTVDGVEITSGVDSPFITSAKATISQFQAQATQLYVQNVVNQCTQNGDPFSGVQVLGIMRQLSLSGGDSSALTSALQDALNACPATLELDFSSSFTGSYDQTLGSQQASWDFSGQITANVNVKVDVPMDAAVAAQTPAGDFMVNVGISGSGPETYSVAHLTGTLTVGGTSCTGTLLGANPSTLTIDAGSGDQASRVQFKLQSQYNPRLVSLGGTALCAFCPVYQKTPIGVQVLVNPGMPSESINATCEGGGMEVTESADINSWLALWQTNHLPTNGDSIIMDWQVPGPAGVFAEKDISQPVSSTGDTVTVSGTETTTLKLVNPPAKMQ
jgi:hypothetical protein